MDTNKNEGFRGEAALECGGLTPLSGAEVLLVKFSRHFACLADDFLRRCKRNL
jgi:hypothetical protein